MPATKCEVKDNEYVIKVGYPIISPKGVHIMNTAKTAQYMPYFDVIMGRFFQDYAISQRWTLADLNNPDNAKIIYDSMYDIMRNDIRSRKTSLTPSVQKDILTILKNWPLFATYHSKYHSLVSSEDDLYLLEDQDSQNDGVDTDPSEGLSDNLDEGDTNDEYNRRGDGESALEIATNSLKQVFRFLEKKKVTNLEKRETEEVLGLNGLPTTVDFQSIWNNILVRTAGLKKEEYLLNMLNSDKIFKLFPEVEQIKKLLAIEEENKSMAQISQYAEFVKVFTRPIISLYLGSENKKKDDNITYAYFPQIKGNMNKIISEWKTNFINEDIPDHLRKYTSSKATGGDIPEFHITSLPPIGKTMTKNMNTTNLREDYANDFELLDLLGFKFSAVDFITSPQEKANFIADVIVPTRLLHESLQKRLINGQRITKPVVQLREAYYRNGITVAEGDKNIIDKYLKWESLYSTIAPTLMQRNAVGEKQYEISNDNALSVAVEYLNTSKTLAELYKSPPFRKAGKSHLFEKTDLIQFLFDENGNKRPDRSIKLNNYNGFKPSNSKAKSTRKLTVQEKIRFDFQNMLLYGQNDIMRTETSNSFYTIALLKKDKSKSSPIYTKASFSGSFTGSPEFVETLTRYLDAEIARIKSAKPNSPAAYSQFSIFSEMLSNVPLEGEEMSTQAKLLANPADKTQALFEINRYLERKVIQFKNTLSSLGISEESLMSKTLLQYAETAKFDDFVRAFIANTFTQNVDFASVFSGESYLFPKGDMHKRLKALASTGFLAVNLSDIEKYLRNSQENKDFLKKYALNPNLRNNAQDFQTQVTAEEILMDSAYTKPEFQDQILDSIEARDGTRPDISTIQKSTKDVIKKGIKLADGQGHITVDFHRELSIRFGFWSPDIEVAYKYEGLVYRKMKKQKVDEEEFKRLEELVFSDPGRYTIPVLKITYNGPVLNKDVDVDAKAYDKFSLQPLLPSFIRNHPELNGLNDRMVSKNIGYIKYESGTKQFVRAVVPFDQVGKITPDLYSTELLKEQIKTNVQQKTESVIPTQFVKLAMANLFSEGKAVNPEVNKLYEELLSQMKDIQHEQIGELLNELGFTYDEHFNITGQDVSKFLNIVDRQVESQKLSSNISRSLETTKVGDTTQFKYPLEATGCYQQISDILTGVIDKSLRRYKVNSADFVLVTSARIANNLGFYSIQDGKIKAAECKIALTKEFAKLLRRINPKTGLPIGTLDALNKLLKDKEWVKENEKSLTIIFSRPPVQGQNSMGFAIVQEFMPPTAGNTIMLPHEFVAKAGIDFDYDKEKVIIPAFNDRGEYLETSLRTKEDINKELGKLIRIKFKKINDVNNYVQALHQEMGDVEKLSIEEAEKIEADIEYLKIERDIYLEYIRDWVDNLAVTTESPAVQKYKGMGSQQFMNSLFGEDNYSLIQLMDSDILNYYSLAQEIDKQYQDLKEGQETLDLVIRENTRDIKRAKSKALTELMNYSDRIMPLLYARRNMMDVNSNRLLEKYNQILSLKEQFADLVIPNNTETLNEVILQNSIDLDRIGPNKSVNEDGSVRLPVNGQVYEYLQNLRVWKTFFDSKGLLGAFASENSFQQLINNTGLALNQYYKTVGKGKKRVITTHKISKLFFSKDQRDKVFKDGKVIIANRFNLGGQLKQHLLSEMINLTVDAAKDPRFAELNITWNNVGAVQMMARMGLTYEVVRDIINNPYALKYAKYQQTMDRGTAIAQILYDLGIYNSQTVPVTIDVIPGVTKLPPGKIPQKDPKTGKYYLETTEERRTPLSDPEAWIKIKDLNIQFSEDYLSEERIRELKLKKKPTPKDLNDTLKLISTFISYGRLNSQYRNLQNLYSYDTTKIGSPFEVSYKKNQRNQLIDSELVSREDLDNFEKRAIISPYINNSLISSIFSKFFTITSDPIVMDGMAPIFKDYLEGQSKSSQAIKNLPKIITNDFLKAVVDNLGAYKGKRISAIGQGMITKTPTSTNVLITTTFANLKRSSGWNTLISKYPVLKQFEVDKTDTLKEEASTGFSGMQIYALQFVRSSTDGIAEVESYIQQLRELISPDLKIEGLKKDEIEAIREIAKDMLFIGYYQSGFGKLYQSYQDLIPAEFMIDIYNEAMEKFKGLESDQKRDFMHKFANRFKINNPKYFPVKEEPQSVKFTKIYNIPVIKAAFKAMSVPVLTDINSMTNYSGGAHLYDKVWDVIGRQHGFNKHIHYSTDYYDKLPQDKKNLLEQYYRQVVTWLGRSYIKEDAKGGKLVRRDMIQAANANGVFGVSEIIAPNTTGRKGFINKTNHPVVEGGTGYAVARAIVTNKPAYVFNQEDTYGFPKGWYIWNEQENTFTPTETPILTKGYAGIGSSTNITEDGVNAIHEVYQKTLAHLKSLHPTEEEEVVEPAQTAPQLISPAQQAIAKAIPLEQNFFNGKAYKKTDGTWGKYQTKDGSQSAMEGVVKGSRTESTRSDNEIKKLETLAKLQGIQEGIKGTIVWMEDNGEKSPTKGLGGWTRITSEPFTPNKEDFSRYENWADNVWNDKQTELKQWKSVRFEYLGPEVPAQTLPSEGNDNNTLSNGGKPDIETKCSQ